MAKILAESQPSSGIIRPFGLLASNIDTLDWDLEGCGILKRCCDSNCCPLHDNRDKKTRD